MGSWVRRRFDGIGLTQSPPGRHLAAWQARYGGTVLLCIDVSTSMSGEPLGQAIVGGTSFLAEANDAHYHCGLVLWSSDVERYVPPTAPARTVRHTLSSASVVGGTRLAPALRLGIKELGPLTGDRVMCIFSDSHLGDWEESIALARQLCAMGVRIIVRGLGHGAATALAKLACPGTEDDHQLVEDVAHISPAIASMATALSLRRHQKPKP